MGLRVGLIGCGRIATEGHLPAYAKAGIKVSAICDNDLQHAHRLAVAYGVAVEPDALQLAARADVDIVDIATRPHGRAELVRSLLPLGKPLLVQKPLVYDLEEARQLAAEVRRAGVVVAVNHNARWAPTHARLRSWIDHGRLGEVYAVRHTNRFNEDVTAWYTDHPDYILLDHGLHYLDLVRYLTGRTPTAASAVTWRKPGQRANCPLLYAITLRFDGDPPLVASLSFNNAVPAPAGFHYRLDLDGTKASAGASLERAWLVDADGTVQADGLCEGAWVPDGLIGAFRAFQDALASGTRPPHTLDDHLATLATAVAAVRSAHADGAWTEVT
jgi:predicted dehydrogenase